MSTETSHQTKPRCTCPQGHPVLAMCAHYATYRCYTCEGLRGHLYQADEMIWAA